MTIFEIQKCLENSPFFECEPATIPIENLSNRSYQHINTSWFTRRVKWWHTIKIDIQQKSDVLEIHFMSLQTTTTWPFIFSSQSFNIELLSPRLFFEILEKQIGMYRDFTDWKYNCFREQRLETILET